MRETGNRELSAVNWNQGFLTFPDGSVCRILPSIISFYELIYCLYKHSIYFLTNLYLHS